MRPANHVLQETTYTDAYVHGHDVAGGISAVEGAWTRLLQRHRHLYFSVMAPLSQYSSDDKRPLYYSPTQLATAAATIEARTEHVVALQHQLLRDWHRGATCFQAAWRGCLARRLTRRQRFLLKIERVDQLYFVAFHRRRLAIARRERRVRKAAAHIKSLARRAHVRATLVQRSVRLYLFKCARWRAAATLVRWYRRVHHRAKLRACARRLQRFVDWKRREVQLQELAAVAVAARRKHIEAKQAAYFALQPDHVIVHRLVMARKQDIYRALHPQQAINQRLRSSTEMSVAPLRIPMASKAMLAKASVARSKLR
ncbi:hypothetical protein SPRG_07476 [Saprolegnia parasitica CBS 223.65]|uniref:Uncharacterized protein n=1 Tax=Saprolegnia parasitica (strain CBS 223.65) TaxID=695850 RepID=A0A067CKD4_SAPPC|nr:hypothetical protein SPRG_07476 [Saprolegnia parasitica CBS 223.65]KDO27227.1 hypothetical protein SPRG_07476 [Saprolegnia parasitica CBS 223.65]|eukprot:XP_012202004.1 hypothetical protein SPRG_07476 [Saprolegnia parasitica CBS 223.65]